MIAPLFLLTSTVLAVSQPTPAAQPYFMAKASSAMVKYAVQYRKSGVPEEKASSAAVQAVNTLLAPPQATELVRSAVSYYATAGPSADPTKVAELANKASSYYDRMATNPAYKNFANHVHENLPLFDVAKANEDVQSKLLGIGNRHNVRARKVASGANAAIQSLKADPAGAQAIATGRELARKVANDFKIDTDKVKLHAKIAKSRFVNLLASN